jgi:sugar phosphate isomerase/epimerase
MKIAIVTDEVSGDPETAIELGVSWGVRDFELRGYGSKRVPFLSDYEKDKLQEVLDYYGARLIAISPGLFKFPYPLDPRSEFPVAAIDVELYERWKTGRDRVKYHLNEVLPASIEYGRQSGVDLILSFGFSRGGRPPGPAPDEVLEALAQAAEIVGAVGMRLAIEVENGFWADTGTRTANLIETIDHPSLYVNWDPANALEAGEKAFPAGYRAVCERVAHVHFKDLVFEPGGAVRYEVNGDFDWRGQIAALAKDGYDGYISMESHMQPKVSAGKALVERLKELIGH